MIGAADDLNEVVRVTVVEVRGRTVKLGFQAENDVAIYREEVWDRVRTESQTAKPRQRAERPQARVPYLD